MTLYIIQVQDIEKSLQKIGLTDKEIKVYLVLLSGGITAIRKIAEKAGINRGTTYELLKKLQRMGLVSYFHQGKQQHFVAEEPRVLFSFVRRKKKEILEAESDLEKIVSELSLGSKHSSRPLIKFYEKYSGIRTILEDVLESTAKLPKKEYSVYSSYSISPYLYHAEASPDFTEIRIKKKIHVRTIGIGPGGSLKGNDERKWLTRKEGAPTYTIIYAGKVAMISVGSQNTPHGLIIEDEAVYKTQLLIFNSLWKNL